MERFRISRSVEIPDALRISRYRSLPNLGPRILFFSGGSALNGISRRLKSYTHNSIHLITPFDSGGSSQELRAAFDMPAVGDLRSRLMALADESELGQPVIYRLFSHRLPVNAVPADLRAEFDSLVDGSHPLIRAVSEPMRSLILQPLQVCAEQLPDDFDFRRASVGNLILAGGYLENGRKLEPVLFIMSKMVAVRGTVRAIADINLQIGAELADGARVQGQRQLTGKETGPLTQPIRRLFLSDGASELDRSAVRLPSRNRDLLETADLICYPPGSLFSSVIANLLPMGVGTGIAHRNVPKVYLPSIGADPECPGLRLEDQADALVGALRADVGKDCALERLLNVVICDGDAVSDAQARKVERTLDVPVLRLELQDPERPGTYEPGKTCEALLSLT